jgi:hypothetical protein
MSIPSTSVASTRTDESRRSMNKTVARLALSWAALFILFVTAVYLARPSSVTPPDDFPPVVVPP